MNPKHPHQWHYVFPVAVVLLGFYLVQKFGWAWDTGITLFLFGNISTSWAWYIAFEHAVDYGEYKRLERRVTTPSGNAAGTEFKPVSVPDLAPATTLRVNSYGTTLSKVQINLEKYFANTLIHMRDANLKIDLTETRWKKVFGSRDAFLEVVDKWKSYELIARESARRNASYKVIDWKTVERIAHGEIVLDVP